MDTSEALASSCALALHDHVKRLLGVDLLANPRGIDPAGALRYLRPVVALLSDGFISGEAAALFRRFFPDADPTWGRQTR